MTDLPLNTIELISRVHHGGFSEKENGWFFQHQILGHQIFKAIDQVASGCLKIHTYNHIYIYIIDIIYTYIYIYTHILYTYVYIYTDWNLTVDHHCCKFTLPILRYSFCTNPDCGQMCFEFLGSQSHYLIGNFQPLPNLWGRPIWSMPTHNQVTCNIFIYYIHIYILYTYIDTIYILYTYVYIYITNVYGISPVMAF